MLYPSGIRMGVQIHSFCILLLMEYLVTIYQISNIDDGYDGNLMTLDELSNSLLKYVEELL